MRAFQLFALIILGALFISCEDDPVILEGEQLNLDGPNLTAPILQAGSHEACARFTSNLLAEFEGRDITSLDIFFQTAPTVARIKIYQGQGSSADIPGNVLLDQNITNDIVENQFTNFILDEPITIGASGLWICTEVLHTSPLGSIGCDVGPAVPNGDWYRSASDNVWLTFREQTNNEASINWNIRARVE